MTTTTSRWLTALLVGAVLAACGTGDDMPATAPGADDPTGVASGGTGAPHGELVAPDRIGDAGAPNTFTFQATQGHSHQAPTPHIAEGFAEIYQQWAEDHPDWQIEIDVIPSAEVTQNMAVLLEEARVGRAPDCAEIDSFVIAQFIEQDLLQPLNEYFSQEEIDDLFPFVRDVVFVDGNLYAFWWNTDLRVLYHRTDLIPEAPRSWDELIERAVAATEQAPEVDGFLFNGGRWEATTFDNLAHFWAQGGELVDDQGRPIYGEGDNREHMVNTMAFLRELVDSGAAPERVNTILEYDEFNTAAQAGTVASFLGGHWQYGQLEEILDDEQFAAWDFAPIPGPADGEHVTGTGGWTIGAFTDDPDTLAACMEFARSVYRGPANVAAGQLPTSARLFEELDEFQSEPYQRFAELLEDGRARPGVAVYPQISEHLQVAIGQLLVGELTPEQAVDQAYEQSLAAYEDLAG
jgi:multiple sugar transport system substrate-binding protein